MSYNVTRAVGEDGEVYWFDGHLDEGELFEAIGSCTFMHLVATDARST